MMHWARRREWNQQLRPLARLLQRGRRHDGLLSRGELVRELPSAVPRLGMHAYRVTASNWIVSLHRAASRGPNMQRGVRRRELLLRVVSHTAEHEAPCSQPACTDGRRHRHQNRGVSFDPGDLLRARSDRVDDIGDIRRLGAGARRHDQQLNHETPKRPTARRAAATARSSSRVESSEFSGVGSGSQGTRRTPWNAARATWRRMQNVWPIWANVFGATTEMPVGETTALALLVPARPTRDFHTILKFQCGGHNCFSIWATQFCMRLHVALAADPGVRHVPRDPLPTPENSLDSTLDEGRAVAAVRRAVSILC